MLCFQRYSKVLEMCKGLYGLAAIREMKVNSMYSLIVQDTHSTFFLYLHICPVSGLNILTCFFFFLFVKRYQIIGKNSKFTNSPTIPEKTNYRCELTQRVS